MEGRNDRRKRAKCALDDKVVRKGLFSKKFRFRRFRSKPILTKDDGKACYKFAKSTGTSRSNGGSQVWPDSSERGPSSPIATLTCFPVYTNGKSRDLAAMHEVTYSHLHTHVHTQRYMYHVRAHVLYKSSWFPRPTIRQLRQPYDNYTTTHTTTYTTTHIHSGKQWLVCLHNIEKLYYLPFKSFMWFSKLLKTN